MRTDTATSEISAKLQSAVSAGVIDRETAEKLMPFLQRGNTEGEIAAGADEEQLRLITSFNDIFVTIGLVLFLGALYYLALEFGSVFAAGSAAVACWVLAEFFTRRKRMALPSIVLLLAFTGMVLTAALSFLAGGMNGTIFEHVTNNGPALSMAALAAAAATAAHWLRFKVPITVAAGLAALIIMVLAVLESVLPEIVVTHQLPVFLPIGLATFALAMWYDASDRERRTRRTDVAFWLHLLAAPIIVHPIVSSLGVTDSSAPGDAMLIIGMFLILCFMALIVDRRALLVSSLGYLAYAAYSLVATTGWSTAATSVAVLVVGAVVLMLSAAWRPLREIAVGLAPLAIRSRVPDAV